MWKECRARPPRRDPGAVALPPLQLLFGHWLRSFLIIAGFGAAGCGELPWMQPQLNRVPRFVGPIPSAIIAAGDSVAMNAASYFSDPDGDALTFSAASTHEPVATVRVADSTLTVAGLARGSARITVTATDPGDLSAGMSFDVTVPNRAPAPLGSMPAATIAAGTTAAVIPASYFSDPDGDALSFSASTSDIRVAWASAADTMVTIGALGAGIAIITVTATDPDGSSAEQTFTATVPNRSPEAVGAMSAATIAAGETAAMNAASYFSDPDGDALTYSAASAVTAVAAASASDSTVTLAGMAKGIATITVTATDPGGLSAEQTFTATVPNRSPEAVGSMPPAAVAVGDEAAMNAASCFTDPDGDALTYTASSSDEPVAMASVSDSTVRVVAMAKGIATITVTATDSSGLSAAFTFGVTVPNRSPEPVGAIPSATIAVGDSATVFPASYYTDPDGDALTYSASSSDTRVALVSVALFKGIAAITVRPGATGSTTITVTATDPGGLSAQQTFVLTVPKNRSPRPVGSIPWATIAVGDSATVIPVSYFNDPDGDALIYSASSSDSRVVLVHGTSSITVTALAKGSARITVTANDPGGLRAEQPFTATVPNRSPVAVGTMPPVAIVGSSSSATVLGGYFTDPDGDPLAYTAASSDSRVAMVSVALLQGRAAITVSPVGKGRATITVTAADPEGLSAEQTFVVTAPNQGPVAVGAMPPVTFNHGARTVGINPTAYFRDPEGDALTYTASSSDTLLAVVSVALLQRRATITLTTLAKGSARITVTATDPGGLSAAQRFTVTLGNRAPTAVGTIPALTIPAATTAVVIATSYFTDPDGDALTYSASSSDNYVAWATAADSTVTLAGVGKGSARITVSATDPGGLSAALTFEVIVPNRAPEAVEVALFDTIAAGDSAAMNAASYFTDPDGDALTFSASSSDSTVATVTVADTTVTVVGVGKGSAVVTVIATDSEGSPGALPVAITVAGRAPEPVGSIPADTIIAAGDSLTVNAAAYFTDPDEDPLTYSAVSADSTVAKVTVADSTLTVVGVGKDSVAITVTATDPDGLSAQQTFVVTVLNQPPNAVGSMPALSIVGSAVVLRNPAGYFTDPDGDALTYSASSDNTGAAGVDVVLVQASARIRIWPFALGNATITVTATDPGGLSAHQTFIVTVPNQPPKAFYSIPPDTLSPGDSVTVRAASYFRDPEGGVLTFSASSDNLAVGVSGPVGAGATFTVTVFSAVGSGANITVTATDSDSLSAQDTFVVTVPNQAPVPVGTMPDMTIAIGDTVTVDAAPYFHDPEAMGLSYSAYGASSVVSLAEDGGFVTVYGAAAGSGTVTVFAMDAGWLGAHQYFTVTVTIPSPPNTVGSVPDGELAQETVTIRDLVRHAIPRLAGSKP